MVTSYRISILVYVLERVFRDGIRAASIYSLLHCPFFRIYLASIKCKEVLVESDKTMGKYTGPAGVTVLPTSAHVNTTREA